MSKKTVLIVEDNYAIRNVIEEFLGFLLDTSGIRIVSTDKESEAETILLEEEVVLLITDVNLGIGGDGMALVNALNKKENRPYIVVMSSIEWLHNVHEYLSSGMVDSFLNKPFSIEELKTTLMLSQTVDLK